jgi:hypothetical protein
METGRGNCPIGSEQAHVYRSRNGCTLPQEPEGWGVFLKSGKGPWRRHSVAGVGGFEPPNGGIKVRVLSNNECFFWGRVGRLIPGSVYS